MFYQRSVNNIQWRSFYTKNALCFTYFYNYFFIILRILLSRKKEPRVLVIYLSFHVDYSKSESKFVV